MNRQQYNEHINALGVPGLHRTAALPAVTTTVDKLICTRIGRTAQEDIVVNSYGVTGRQILIKAASLAAPVQKYDVIVVGGQEYTIEAVIPKLEIGTGFLMGWVCYSVGD